VPVRGGEVERLVEGRRAIGDFSTGPGGRIAVASSATSQPTEVFAVERGELRKLSGHNDAWLAELQLGPVEEISF
ncbi:MAG: S9 family peptidase, partial [Gemmatimonadales bacterium]